MDIILVRHAVAMEREQFKTKFKKDDSLRPLVMKGRNKMRAVARHLRQSVPKADLIVTSPFARAQQTAQILNQFYPRTKVEEAAELVPTAPPEAFLNWLHTKSNKIKTMLVVGHEPQLSLFASYCLSGKNVGMSESFIELKKAGALCLEIDALTNLDASTAQLKWLITPKLFGI